ncbi:glycosyltransferase family 4 protein [Spirosoma humi]
MNVGILFSDFGPYHAVRIEALAAALSAQESKLFAFQFSKSSNIYGWKPVLPVGVDVVTLAEKPPEGPYDAFKVARAFRTELQKRNIDVVFLPSYSPLPNLLCLVSAKFLNRKTIMMIDSWHGSEQARLVGRWLKHLIIRLFDASLVAGTPQREYAYAYGQKRSRVFLGYDAVDINYFMQESKRWKDVPTQDLPIPNLPARYFLNLGRFVTKKNIGTLIQAYAQLVKLNHSMSIALVLVGEGSEENAIRQLATDLNLHVRNGLNSASRPTNGPEVVFYPFQQIDKTPLFFSHCEAFILPSLYEEWGLVINEAMACAAAVLVSDNVGCAQDLVEEGKNGFCFDPTNVDQLCNLLQQFVVDPTLARRLGNKGSVIIREWGPDRFAEGALNAIQSVESLSFGADMLKTNI